MSRGGQTILVRGGAMVPTSRFLVQSGTQVFTSPSDGIVAITWDETLNGYDSFNDLGLDADYHTSGYIVPLDGDYLITVKVRLSGDAPFTSGNARVDIVDGGSPALPTTNSLAVDDQDAVVAAVDVRRYTAGGNESFNIEIALENAAGPSTVTITEASVTITKLR